MNKDEVRSGIAASWRFLEALGIGDAFVTPTPLGVDDAFRDAVLDPDSSYVSIYELGLKRSHYNIQVSDLAFFQYSWAGEAQVRYAYYPNPFISGNAHALGKLQALRDMEEAEMLDKEDVLVLISSMTSSATVPLIRYENAPEQYRGLQHPCSHFHIGLHGENRWPISRVLTPLAFTMWVAKQYYPDAWRSTENAGDPLGNPLEGQLVAERMNCRILGDDLFSAAEGRSPHFT